MHPQTSSTGQYTEYVQAKSPDFGGIQGIWGLGRVRPESGQSQATATEGTVEEVEGSIDRIKLLRFPCAYVTSCRKLQACDSGSWMLNECE